MVCVLFLKESPPNCTNTGLPQALGPHLYGTQKSMITANLGKSASDSSSLWREENASDARICSQIQDSGTIDILHFSWRPQSSGKGERANHFLKNILEKLIRETSQVWVTLLPIALLSSRITPKYPSD